MDFQLFPRNEEWATGDEALDFKLTAALNRAASHLSYLAINDFFEQALAVKTRVYNPYFIKNIEFVVKALLFYLNQEIPINLHYKKFILKAYTRNVSSLELLEAKNIVEALHQSKHFRFNGELDFHLHDYPKEERNPFVKVLMPREEKELEIKILFKELRHHLEGELILPRYQNAFYQNLSRSDLILNVDNLFEVWFYDGRIFSNLITTK